MDQKDFKFKLKNLTDTGMFEGLGAVYGNVDQGKDRILHGAFNRTLSPGRTFPVLFNHKTDFPIGFCTIQDSLAGLQVKGTLELTDPTAQKAYTFMKSGVIRGLSIGYDVVQASYDGDVRNLSELKLYEISAVLFPMNESAQISAVKSLSDSDRATHLKGIDSHRKQINRSQRAIHEHLKALFDTGPDEDEIDDDECDDDLTKALVIELKDLYTHARKLV